jgi:excisionase family DNA binding protein
MAQKLATFNQAAASWGCTVSAVRRWRREGRIAVVKLGRLVRIPEAEVDRIAREGIRPAERRSK